MSERLSDLLADHGRYVDKISRRLAGHQRREVHIDGYRRAAVAVLLRASRSSIQIPFIVRPETMRAHSGQIALPGGRVDDTDASAAAAAVRESEEELGIEGSRVQILGLLDDVPTPSKFVITPVVAVLNGEADYRPNPHEVDEAFEAELTAFADRSAAEDMGEREHWGVKYQLHAYRVGPHRIWGATARIIESLIDLSD